MCSPLAYQRAFYLARGVQYELNSLEERLLSDYFFLERQLRFYEQKMQVLSSLAIVSKEAWGKLGEIEKKYYKLLFPENVADVRSFVRRADDIMKEFVGKKFSFSGDERHVVGHVTEDTKLKEQIEKIARHLSNLHNANS